MQPKASQTAIHCCVHRAAHQVFDDDPKILPDPISVGLVAETEPAALHADEARHRLPFMRRLRGNFVLRSRLAEDRLAASVRRCIGQYVLLGAGLDTFPYRQPNWARDLFIIELDHCATQKFKIDSLKSAGVSVPSNVRFAQIDFSRETLADKLRHVSLDHNKPLFVSWLGVNQYLTRDTVAETLRAVAAWRGGSEIALTYVADDWSDLDSEGRAAMALAESNAAACGEPWRSKFSQLEFTGLVRACGFSQCQLLPLKDAGEPLFANRTDLLRPAGGSALVLAWT